VLETAKFRAFDTGLDQASKALGGDRWLRFGKDAFHRGPLVPFA
jgi:hypothetical protein